MGQIAKYPICTKLIVRYLWWSTCLNSRNHSPICQKNVLTAFCLLLFNWIYLQITLHTTFLTNRWLSYIYLYYQIVKLKIILFKENSRFKGEILIILNVKLKIWPFKKSRTKHNFEVRYRLSSWELHVMKQVQSLKCNLLQ